MHRRPARALIARLGLAFLTGAGGQIASAEPAPATYLGSYHWVMDDPQFGGFSAIDMAGDGASFTAISDRGRQIAGTLIRNDGGQITDITASPLRQLRNTQGRPLAGRALSDAEGLARAQDGGFFISFEGDHRIAYYPDLDAAAQPVPGHPDFDTLPDNGGLEALAINAQGHLYTLPEQSAGPDDPFTVYRFTGADWDIPFLIPRSGAFLAVGADFGPDGWFYLLERALTGPGFRSRVRRFQIIDDILQSEETLLDTPTRRHDNLEGISVWQDGTGQIRITMIADDNLMFFQRTEIVEYSVQPPLASAPLQE